MAYLVSKDGLVIQLGEENLIGRSSSCDVILDNSYVSRRHARIFRDEEGWFIEDLDSTYGTFVDGKQVKGKTRLREGTQVKIGPLCFTFNFERKVDLEVNVAKILEEVKILKDIIEEETFQEYLTEVERVLKVFDELKRERDEYRFLAELSDRLREESVEDILKFVLRGVMKLTEAQSGCLVKVKEDNTFEVVDVLNMNAKEVKSGKDALSTSIIRKTIEKKEPILIENALDDELWSGVTSVLSLRLRSVLSLPVVREDRVICVLYLENRELPGIFTEKELKLVKRVERKIRDVIGLFIHYRTLDTRNRFLLEELRKKYDFQEIVGNSPSLIGILDLVGKVTTMDVPVLIKGESGTGKELIARAIHYNSKRAGYPLITINCAAIPEDLMEAEFFGFKKGAFSGASQNRKGKFMAANGGTIFLDEIAELPLNLQAKLLRAIQFREITPLGSDETEHVDVRIIAATSKDLKQLVKEGKFREDLYYRLNVIEIELPPLRERKEDIPHLIDHFLRKYAAGEKHFSKTALNLLLRYDYPGNVRELENIVRRAILLSGDREVITEEFLPDDVKNPVKRESHTGFSLLSEEEKKQLMIKTLRENEFNITKTAKTLGISRRHLYRLMEKYNIKKEN